jgi:hypothetical protein
MNYSDFDETDLEIAKEELNEITEKKEEKILEVKKLCKNSDKIQSFCHERLDDQFLVSSSAQIIESSNKWTKKIY